MDVLLGADCARAVDVATHVGRDGMTYCGACDGRMMLEPRITGNSITDGIAWVCLACGRERNATPRPPSSRLGPDCRGKPGRRPKEYGRE